MKKHHSYLMKQSSRARLMQPVAPAFKTPANPISGPFLSASLAILILIASAIPTRAQTQFAGWLGTFQNYKLNNKVGLYFDGQFRTTDQMQHMQALLIRPGVNFYLTPNLTATVGYAYIPHRKTAGGLSAVLPEHRTWQQLIYAHPVHLSHHSRATAVQHRLRLEQRYLPKAVAHGDHLSHDGFNYAGRLRYFVRGVIPLTGKNSADKEDSGSVAAASASTSGNSKSSSFDNGFFASIQNEIFGNLGNTSLVNGKFFDQNRAYVSLGYRFSKQFDLEAGYMNQYISGTGNNSTNNHIVQLATYLRL